jgi:hypothetical protein
LSEQRERARFFLLAAETLEIYANEPLQRNSCKDMLALWRRMTWQANSKGRPAGRLRG